MTATGRTPGDSAGATVWFLSDYGLDDGFVGICRAVLRRVAPLVAVVDLTHGIPAFDVRAGAQALVRAFPHLGPGAVLAVVDPGVGGDRRGVVLEIAAGGGPRWLVGPDNGLLVPAADAAGGPVAAWSLPTAGSAAVTFDGRDVFAPAAGRLAAGADPAALGEPLSPDRLVRLSAPLAECTAGRVRASATWVDRFGNVQLAARGATGPAPGTGLAVGIEGRPSHHARRVRAFSDLAPGELGVLDDADGQLAIVCWRSSAAAFIGVAAGDVVTLSW